MDRRTVIAIIISVVIITIGFTVQAVFFPPNPPPETAQTQQTATPAQQPAVTPSTGQGQNQPSSPTQPTQQNQTTVSVPTGQVVPVPVEGLTEKTYEISTNLVTVHFTNKGGDITSYELLKHLDNGEPVNMVFNDASGQDAMALHFGGPDAPPVDTLFQVHQVNDHSIEFYRSFYITGNESEPFTVRKTFTFKDGEYLMQADITIENSVNKIIPLDFNGTAYTLSYGPQIGPKFTHLDGRNDYRKFVYLLNGKKKDVNLRPGNTQQLKDQVTWAAITGKYFSVIGIPDNSAYTIQFSSQQAQDIPQGDRMFFERPQLKSSRNTDVYRFYVGPKVQSDLTRYDQANSNAWGVANLKLENVQDSRVLLGWLENILKFFLQLFYKVIPNYGVAIILLTVLVKLVLYPLTRKSFQSTSKMQALAPKMEEIKKKYKDNPTKQNQEIAALYKKEGVNPLGGCLPMLLQFPIFIAMYGLFNNSFDLRGAVFIPGWISDLSSPESILNFGNFTIPILGWNDLRLLPIIYVASQLISSKLMQTPGAGSTGQMKMMTYALPVVFFFILYNVPSGLLVYWIVTNVLTAAQQYYIAKIRYPHLHPQNAQAQPARAKSKK